MGQGRLAGAAGRPASPHSLSSGHSQSAGRPAAPAPRPAANERASAATNGKQQPPPTRPPPPARAALVTGGLAGGAAVCHVGQGGLAGSGGGSALPWQRINQQPEAAAPPGPARRRGKPAGRGELQVGRPRRGVPELGLTDTGWAHPRSPMNGPAQPPHRAHRAPLGRASPAPAGSGGSDECLCAPRRLSDLRLLHASARAPARRARPIPG